MGKNLIVFLHRTGLRKAWQVSFAGKPGDQMGAMRSEPDSFRPPKSPFGSPNTASLPQPGQRQVISAQYYDNRPAPAPGLWNTLRGKMPYAIPPIKTNLSPAAEGQYNQVQSQIRQSNAWTNNADTYHQSPIGQQIGDTLHLQHSFGGTNAHAAATRNLLSQQGYQFPSALQQPGRLVAQHPDNPNILHHIVGINPAAPRIKPIAPTPATPRVNPLPPIPIHSPEQIPNGYTLHPEHHTLGKQAAHKLMRSPDAPPGAILAKDESGYHSVFMPPVGRPVTAPPPTVPSPVPPPVAPMPAPAQQQPTPAPQSVLRGTQPTTHPVAPENGADDPFEDGEHPDAYKTRAHPDGDGFAVHDYDGQPAIGRDGEVRKFGSERRAHNAGLVLKRQWEENQARIGKALVVFAWRTSHLCKGKAPYTAAERAADLQKNKEFINRPLRSKPSTPTPKPVEPQGKYVKTGLPGIIHANHELFSVMAGNGSNPAGMFLSPKNLDGFKANILEAADDYPQHEADLHDLHRAVDKAHADGGYKGISILFPNSPRLVARTQRHETIHRNWQTYLSQQPDGGKKINRLLDDHLGRHNAYGPIYTRLISRGYDVGKPGAMLDETLAHVLGGGYSALGLSAGSAYDLARHLHRRLQAYDPAGPEKIFPGGNVLSRRVLKEGSQGKTDRDWANRVAFDKSVPIPKGPESRFVQAARPGRLHLTPEGVEAMSFHAPAAQWLDHHSLCRKLELLRVSARNGRLGPEEQTAYHNLSDTLGQANNAGGQEGVTLVPPGASASEVAGGVRRARIASNLNAYSAKLAQERPRRHLAFENHLKTVVMEHPLYDDASQALIAQGHEPYHSLLAPTVLQHVFGGGYSNLGLGEPDAMDYGRHIVRRINHFDQTAAPSILAGGNAIARGVLREGSPGPDVEKAVRAYRLYRRGYLRRKALTPLGEQIREHLMPYKQGPHKMIVSLEDLQRDRPVKLLPTWTDRAKVGEYHNPDTGVRHPLMGGRDYPLMPENYGVAGWAHMGSHTGTSFLNNIQRISKSGADPVGVVLTQHPEAVLGNKDAHKIYHKEIQAHKELGRVDDGKVEKIIRFTQSRLQRDPQMVWSAASKAAAMKDYGPDVDSFMHDLGNTSFDTRKRAIKIMGGRSGAGEGMPSYKKVQHLMSEPSLEGVPTNHAVAFIQYAHHLPPDKLNASDLGVPEHASYKYPIPGIGLGNSKPIPLSHLYGELFNQEGLHTPGQQHRRVYYGRASQGGVPLIDAPMHIISQYLHGEVEPETIMNRTRKAMEGIDVSHTLPRTPEEAEFWARANKECDEEDAKDKAAAEEERRITRQVMAITIPPRTPIVPAHLLKPPTDD